MSTEESLGERLKDLWMFFLVKRWHETFVSMSEKSLWRNDVYIKNKNEDRSKNLTKYELPEKEWTAFWNCEQRLNGMRGSRKATQLCSAQPLSVDMIQTTRCQWCCISIIFFNWRIIALQCFGCLCHTSTWINNNYKYTYDIYISLPTWAFLSCM